MTVLICPFWALSGTPFLGLARTLAAAFAGVLALPAGVLGASFLAAVLPAVVGFCLEGAAAAAFLSPPAFLSTAGLGAGLADAGFAAAFGAALLAAALPTIQDLF